MNNKALTIIYFDIGKYSCEEDKMVWKQNTKPRAIAMKMSMMDISYIDLLRGICGKLRKDGETTKLRLSYIALLSDWEEAIHIDDDDGVLAYLTSFRNNCRCLLHVELVEVQNLVDEGNRACNSKIEVTGGDYEGVIGVVDESNGKGNDEIVVGEPTTVDDNRNANTGNEEGEPTGVDGNCNENTGNEEEEPTDVDGNCNENTGNEEEEQTGDPAGVLSLKRKSCVAEEWDDGLDLERDQSFENKEDVYDIIQKGSHLNCFEFVILKSDKQRFVVKCREWMNGCKWGVRVAAPKGTSYFSVRTYYQKHSCSRSDISTSKKRRKGTARLVSGVVRKTYRDGRKTPAAKSLIGVVQAEVGVKVSYSTAWRGKRLAANHIRGCPRVSYGNLYSYLFMLEKMNPKTVSFVRLDEQGRFKCLFFALGASIEGFQVIRKVLIVDATHIKTTEGGVLMVITAQDGNHHHYPLAFGVLDGENDPHSSEWVVPESVKAWHALPPAFAKRKRGRRQERRILSTGEYGTRRQQRQRRQAAANMARWFNCSNSQGNVV